MKTDLDTIKHKAAVVAALTVLYPFLFTFGYLAIVKTAVIDKE